MRSIKSPFPNSIKAFGTDIETLLKPITNTQQISLKSMKSMKNLLLFLHGGNICNLTINWLQMP